MERGTTGEEVTSPDPLDGDPEKSDEGELGLSPLSSQYSSCGESEFDRYCSSNSVMGTPSVCSSMGMFHDSIDSDFGSLKSLEGFNLGGGRGLSRYEASDHSTIFGKDRVLGSCSSGAFCGSNDDMEGLSPGGENALSNIGDMPMLGSKAELKGVKAFDSEVGKKENLAVLLKNVENVFLQGAVAARSAAENLLVCNHADEMEDERCQEEDEASSRYEHSDGEDSMFNYGSDDGSRPNAYYVKNIDNKCVEEAGCGNLMLMNPSVAFGSKDLEDFEMEGTEENEGIQLPNKFWERQQSNGDNETDTPAFTSVVSTSKEILQEHVQTINEREVNVRSNDRLVGDESLDSQQSRPIASLQLPTPGSCIPIVNNDLTDEYLENCYVYNIFEKQCPSIYVPVNMSSTQSEEERGNLNIPCDQAGGSDDHSVLKLRSDLRPDTDCGFDVFEDDKVKSHTVHVPDSVSSWLENDKARNLDDLNHSEDKFITSKGKDFEMGAFYDDIVHEMEEILLDSCDSSAKRLTQKHSIFHSGQSSSPMRDGGSSASTSGLDGSYPLILHPFKIYGIEVVGAKQRKGDVSLSERLVGVREYTVYIIRVWNDKTKWEVERRYRDFHTLYRRLKTYFAAQEWILPPSWSFVERESRKLFGNASPHVISERSTLIQECLSSILRSKYFSSLPNALVWFLSPPAGILSSSQSNDAGHPSNVGTNPEIVFPLGMTISLIVDLRPQKSKKELLDKQHYMCAGCHKEFDDGKTRMQEFAQSFGWGKPRFCEYTGQLFCSSCHTNETVVLPARVLHQWDFSPYPVSQLAKSYLDSIIDKPMLCVSAANPFLFSKVPTLLHTVGVRRKIGTMLPHIRCSFRRSVYRRLGYRKYLLESNDFFALRDLVDLSKGAFAALPAILEAVLKKMQEHITELCLECCDNGVPCGARQACNNPSSLIFPFQDEMEIQQCNSCNSVFHKSCFNKLTECPCGVVFKEIDAKQSLAKLRLGNTGSELGSSSSLATALDMKSPVEFISSLFSMSRKEKMKDQKGQNVILMGSLPSNSL